MTDRTLTDQRRRLTHRALSVGAMAAITLGTAFIVLSPFAHGNAAGGASVWLQTLDSCKQGLGGSVYRITDSSGSYNSTASTPAATPHSIASGSCPLQRGNCASKTTGCVQISGLPFPDTFTIRQIATPPSNPSNPQGYAPCNGGSACQWEVVNLTINAAGQASAVTTDVEPDGTRALYPSSGTAAGTAADPMVYHDFGLGTGSCDGDGDADDHLTGSPSSHCGYPEAQEATACQPFPWSCSLTGPPPVQATHFSLSSPSAPQAGSAFTETVIALDKNNNPVTSYAGSVNLQWSGPSSAPNGTAPRYPADPISFKKGVATVSVVLYDAQATALGVSDGSISGTSPGFAVAPAGASQLTGSVPGNQTAGNAFNVTVSALDPYMNVATSYAGGKSLAWSGPSKSPNGTAPAYPSSVSFSNGTGAASVTLYDAQTTALHMIDGAISGATAPFAVSPGAPAALSMQIPSSSTFNQPDSVTVNSFDAWGNAATNDNSTLSLSSSDLLASYPSSVSMSGGAASFSVTFRTPGQQTLTGSESGGPSTTGSTSVAL